MYDEEKNVVWIDYRETIKTEDMNERKTDVNESEWLIE